MRNFRSLRRGLWLMAGLLAGSYAVMLPATVFAHGEQLNVGGGPGGPVVLAAAQTKALGLQTALADMRPIEELLELNGTVAVLPNAQADVSLRISGRIEALRANVGDTVRKGTELARVQSRAIGNPPPVVSVPSPIDGIIDARNVILGQSVEPDTALFRVSNRVRMRVIARVYEEDLGRVGMGQSAHVELLAYPQRLFEGRVTLVSPNLDAESRTVEVWIELENVGALLKPNMFARADVVIGGNTAALAIPKAAIMEAGGEQFVFVREGNKYRRQDVQVGASDELYSEITDGLVPGDEVVTQGSREVYTLWLTGGSSEAEEHTD